MKVLICIDSSESNKAAIHKLSLFVKNEDTILLFHSYTDPLPDADFPGFEDLGVCISRPERVMDARKSANDLLDRVANEIREDLSKDQKECHIEKLPVFISDPREAIISTIKENNVDITILGSRGFGTIKSVLLGSVSTYVVQHSPTSVLVVR
eukprot:TRINITY_DN9029_c0_g1_i1.p1 TRINITY_DN9029_c0_g1~~TRINITY_DN9029_c0_g1_i1.p1  ORF type:complete len:163 (-),score=30.85 TRINITY_DN9029_c0_g1_i1:46-504(-)